MTRASSKSIVWPWSHACAGIGTTFENFGVSHVFLFPTGGRIYSFLGCNSMCSPHRGFYRQRSFADLMEVLSWETQLNSCCRVLTGLVVARMPLLLRILVSGSVTPLIFEFVSCIWGTSSNDRAPVLHAGSAGTIPGFSKIENLATHCNIFFPFLFFSFITSHRSSLSPIYLP